MIHIRIYRDREDGPITSYDVQGHAQFADYGQDIVCAGVSAITIGTVNAVEKVTGIELVVRVDEGDLAVTVPEVSNPVSERVQIILESMIVMLQSIEEEYGDFVEIEQYFDHKGG